MIGATGTNGRPVAHELVAAGFSVTALVREPEKARLGLPAAVRLLPGDLRDPTSLDHALADQHVVYLNLSVAQTERAHDFHPESEGLANLLAAVRRRAPTQLLRIVYLSSLVHQYQGLNGFDWWAFRVKQQALALLRDSGVAHTVFYPSTFMETLLAQVQGKKLILAGNSLFPMHFIAGHDYGRMVAEALRHSMNHADNQHYIVQGPEALTLDGAARQFIANNPVAGLQPQQLPLKLLRMLGWFSARFNYLAHILEAINRYPEAFAGEAAWRDLHKPTTTVAAFARQVGQSAEGLHIKR
jgi:uncharacterized protein YbjT (DUF2867 family)